MLQKLVIYFTGVFSGTSIDSLDWGIGRISKRSLDESTNWALDRYTISSLFL